MARLPFSRCRDVPDRGQDAHGPWSAISGGLWCPRGDLPSRTVMCSPSCLGLAEMRTAAHSGDGNQDAPNRGTPSPSVTGITVGQRPASADYVPVATAPRMNLQSFALLRDGDPRFLFIALLVRPCPGRGVWGGPKPNPHLQPV